MKIIIRMTDEEFDDLQERKHFKTPKDMATYIENTENGGEPIDILQVEKDEMFIMSVYVRGMNNDGTRPFDEIFATDKRGEE